MAYGYIYKITNPSGKIYIGQTINLARRKNRYKNSKCVNQILIYNSIQKYGWDNHNFEVIEEIINEDYPYEILDSLEKYYIGFYKSNRNRYPQTEGLNLTDGGDGMRGFKHSDQTKKLIGEKGKGYKHTPEAKAKISKAGKRPCSEEKKRKLSESNKAAYKEGRNTGGKPRKTKAEQRERARLTNQRWLVAHPEFREKKNLERRKLPQDKVSREEHNRKVSEARMLSDKINRVPVICYNIDRSEEVKFKSLKEAADFANCSSSTVARHIKSNTLLTNKYWKYESTN